MIIITSLVPDKTHRTPSSTYQPTTTTSHQTTSKLSNNDPRVHPNRHLPPILRPRRRRYLLPFPSPIPPPPTKIQLTPSKGNISRPPPTAAGVAPTDLETPTIKSDHYTTGRGGTGNMAKNDPLNPSIARERQDVASLPRRLSEGESFFGRGTFLYLYISLTLQVGNLARGDEDRNGRGGC